jgi:hypothetical protein
VDFGTTKRCLHNSRNASDNDLVIKLLFDKIQLLCFFRHVLKNIGFLIEAKLIIKSNIRFVMP